MKTVRSAVVVAILFLVAFVARPAGAADKVAPASWLIHLNGIGGERSCDHMLIRGLQQAGYAGEVRFYDWTGGQIGIEALQGREKHQIESRKIADLITEHYRANPKQPIHLTSHSGGCGLAVWALEQLPDDVFVETLFLFAPALSPDYDLSKALRHVKTKAYAFTSIHDSIVLGTGTKLFGTIDGMRVEAAGRNGFVQPKTADTDQYAKLVAQPYQKEWLLKYGSAGTHICCLRTAFAREYVGSLLLTGAPPAPKQAAAPSTQPAAIR